MKFGLEKCNTLNIKGGKLADPSNVTLSDNITIKSLDENEQYKYLGLKQQLSINDSELKKEYETSFLKRLHMILNTELNAKNKIRAINSWVIPLLSYTFGIISWSKTDIVNLNRKVRTTLTRYRSHHIHSATERLYLPRSEGGRGLIDLESMFAKQIEKYRTYFMNKRSELYEQLRKEDKFTPLHLTSSTFNLPAYRTKQQLKEDLESGTMKGKYPKSLYHDSNIDKKLSVGYLTDGYLMSETEGFLHAIQDQVMKTRNYIKFIMKKSIPTVMCRLCNKTTESIQHLSSGCSFLARHEYTNRHDLVGNIIHQELLKNIRKSNKTSMPHYLYKPLAVEENEEHKIYWNMYIITEHKVIHNKPDILYFNLKEKSASIVDVTIPLDENINTAYMNKIVKYEDLKRQVKNMYNLNNVNILPIVISTNGLVHKNTRENIKTLKISSPDFIVKKCQKSVILSTTSMLRKILSEE
ncbi:hypothetical protein WDU94_009793 [Cyamophila willieti]